ncbi:RNA-directed DNA polymerase, eukaryota, partial [Tanacetum coccineum]
MSWFVFQVFIVHGVLVGLVMSSGLVSISLCVLTVHLSDHRTILLREVLSDFGPTRFGFYQSLGLRMEGFDSMVEACVVVFSHLIPYAMNDLDPRLDKDLLRGNISDDILLNRMDLNRRLQDIKLLEAKDLHKGLSSRLVVFSYWALGVLIRRVLEKNFNNIVNVLNASILGRVYDQLAKSQVVGVGVSLNVVVQAGIDRKDFVGSLGQCLSVAQTDGGSWCLKFLALNRALLLEVGVGASFSGDGSFGCKEIVVANKMGASSVSASFRRDVRDGAERQQWDDLSSIMNSVVLSSSKDRWTCDLSGDGEFKVKVIRNFIDDLLPTRVNLSRRGVLLDSHLCPLCNAAMEDVQHVFFRCDVARVVLRKICRWWDLDWQEICSFSDWDAWFLSFRLSSRLKSILEGVFYVAWWRIWRLRNQLVFDASPPNRSTIFDDI